MRGSRDIWVVVGLLAVLLIGVYYVLSLSPVESGQLSSYGTGQHGAKAFYLLLKESGFRIDRYSGPLSAIPPDARMLLLVEPRSIGKPDERALAQWVKKGNTLFLAASAYGTVPSGLGVHVYSAGIADPESVRPAPGKYAHGLTTVYVEPQLYLEDFSRVTPIIRGREGLVAGEIALGKGRIFFLGDPGMLLNSSIAQEDNAVLLTNVVYENAGKTHRVLFVEWEKIAAAREKQEPVVGIGGKLALAELAFVALVFLISTGRRFGAVHPLAEAAQKRRGWEFVRAMAGLYQRAGASDAALTAVYRSLRRELTLRFGVSQEAGPAETAEAILRSRPVDRARLTALLQRCDRVAHGQKISDGEAVALARAIEECRREPGIAGSTND